MQNTEFKITTGYNEGQRFVSVLHIPSNCGRDFYEDGTAYDWQDGNGINANCSDEVAMEAWIIGNSLLGM